MNERIGAIGMLRGALVPATCIALIAYFAFHAVAGNTGLMRWGGYKLDRATLEAQAATLAERKTNLESKIALLNPHRVDPDLADELVRKDLGVVRADEVVIQLPKAD